MRNIAIALFVVVSLIWLFFTTIMLDEVDNDENNALNDITVKPTEKRNVGIADMKSLAALLGVEYQEEFEVIKEKISENFDVAVEIIVIYTSKNDNKLRISSLVSDDKKQFDMILGDKLYDYTLTAINPSSAVLENGDKQVTLKIFKTTIISVTDLPKEVPDSL